MNIEQESLDSGFVVGHGGADAASKPIVAAGYANKAYKGVRVRAATANTIVIHVGPAGVKTTTGYPLPAGEELEIKIDNPSRINVVATPADNCEQTVTLSGQIVGDTFTLAFNGQTITPPLPVNATALQVQTALRALSTIGAGNCDVTGADGGPYTVEFVGDLAKTDVNLMTGTGTGVNEKQTVAIDDATSSGTFTLTFGGQTTAAIDYNAPAQGVGSVEEKLAALSNIGVGNVAVTGGPGPGTDWVVEFKGTLGLTDVAAMTGDGLLLTGGSTDVTITETQKGDATCTVTVAKVADITSGSQYSWIAL